MPVGGGFVSAHAVKMSKGCKFLWQAKICFWKLELFSKQRVASACVKEPASVRFMRLTAAAAENRGAVGVHQDRLDACLLPHFAAG